MNGKGTPAATPRFPLVTTTWLLTGVLCAFKIASRWSGSDHPAWLVSVAFSRVSFLVTATVAFSWLLLILLQIVLWHGTKTALWMTVLRFGAVALTSILCVAWFASIRGVAAQDPNPVAKPHSVTLHWQPSGTPGAKYNVYRTKTPGTGYVKLNDKPLTELTFIDSHVESGATYYYITRSIDKGQKESLNSNEVKVTIPAS